MPGFAGSHEGYPRGGWENKMNRERLFVFVCETWCIEGKEGSLRLLFSLVSLTMLQTDVVLALCMSYTHIHTQSHTVSCTEVTVMNDTMTLEEHVSWSRNASSFTQSNMVSQETAVEGCKVDLIFFFAFSAKCVGNHAFVLKCASVKLFFHTSCLYISYFVVICVCNLVSAGLHGGCLSCSPSCPNMVLCWL